MKMSKSCSLMILVPLACVFAVCLATKAWWGHKKKLILEGLSYEHELVAFANAYVAYANTNNLQGKTVHWEEMSAWNVPEPMDKARNELKNILQVDENCSIRLRSDLDDVVHITCYLGPIWNYDYLYVMICSKYGSRSEFVQKRKAARFIMISENVAYVVL